MTFYDWVNNNQNKSGDLRELFKIIQKNDDAWRSVVDLTQAKAAIGSDVGLTDADKANLTENLDDLWGDFTKRAADSVDAAPLTRSRVWRAFLVDNIPMLILVVFALSLLFVIYKAIPDEGFLDQLADANKARGLITFFFALGTVGVAIILTAAAFAIDGENREEMRERFDMGKQVLTALIGIFGTILGFYFGSLDSETKTNPNANEEQTQGAGETPGEGNGSDGDGDN